MTDFVKSCIWTMTLAIVLATVILFLGFLLGLTQKAEATELSAGFGVSNAACGSAEPTASVVYDHDGDALPRHIRLAVGPNGSCDGQGVTIDVALQARQYIVDDQWYVYVGAGHDERAVPYEYEETPWGTKQFRTEGVKSTQALIGLGHDFGDINLQCGYNAVKTAMNKGGSLFPIQCGASAYLMDDSFEVDVTTTFETATLSAEYRAIGGIIVGANATFGFHKLKNPAPDYIGTGDHMFSRSKAPSPIYALEVRKEF